jgi:peptide/nickel transport system permease protein
MIDMSKQSKRRGLPKLNARLTIGLTIVTVLAASSLILPFFTSVDPAAQGTYLKNLPPSPKHLLGTNALGQDIFWYLVFAVRNSLLLGVTVSIGITAISTFLGLSAGFHRRLVRARRGRLYGHLHHDSGAADSDRAGRNCARQHLVYGCRRDSDYLWLGLERAHDPLDGADAARARVYQHGALFRRRHLMPIIAREIFPYVYAFMVVGFINTILFAINTEAALAVIGLSNVVIPTLGSIIFWALNYNAIMIGQPLWIIAPIVTTVALFLGLFLTSTGYNELFAERRGVA